MCHNAHCAGSGSITPTFVLAVERWSQQLSHENVNRTEASRHHVGYEVHALPTVFMEVEDSRQLSSLSFNILSNEFIVSGQALTAKYHIVHPFVIRGLTRTTAAEFCCPQKCPKQKLVGGTVEHHLVQQIPFFTKPEISQNRGQQILSRA